MEGNQSRCKTQAGTDQKINKSIKNDKFLNLQISFQKICFESKIIGSYRKY